MMLLQKYGSGSRTVVIFPDLGDSILDRFYVELAKTLAKESSVYLVELRGHALSQGIWSLDSYRADVAYLIAYFSGQTDDLYLGGVGFSASTLLEYDDQAHHFRGRMPPLPLGMLLLSPVFEGLSILPKLPSHVDFALQIIPTAKRPALVRTFTKKGKLSFKHCWLENETIEQFCHDIATYRLMPVRIQTPTELFVESHTHADPLKRIFGNVSIRNARWLAQLRHGKMTSAQHSFHFQEIVAAAEHLFRSERPIRFRVAR